MAGVHGADIYRDREGVGFGVFGELAGGVGLQLDQQFIGPGELAVEAHFVAQDVDRVAILGDRLAADFNFAEAPFLFFGHALAVTFVITFAVHGASGGKKLVAKLDIAVDVIELVVDDGGFGADDALGAPEAVGDLVDEVKLEGAIGIELEYQRVKEVDEGLGVFFVVGGVDDDVLGVEAELDGVGGGYFFAFHRFRAGGAFGVLPVGLELLFGYAHGYTHPSFPLAGLKKVLY